MTTTDEVAALEAERDLLRAQLARARHHKKPYEEMTTDEYRAALDKLGLSIVGSAEHLGLSRRQSQRYANGATPRQPGRQAPPPRHPNRPHRQ